MWKRLFGGRSLPLHQKMVIQSLFCTDPSGRHRARIDKVSQSHWSSGLSIMWQFKKLTRPLPVRPFCGRFIPTPRTSFYFERNFPSQAPKIQNLTNNSSIYAYWWVSLQKNPRKILKKISAYAILKKPQKLGPIWNTTKSRHIIRQNKALDIYSLTNVVFRSFKVTQGQKLPIKGHKGHISIFIKSSQVVHEKGALEMSLLMTLVSRSIKVTQAQNLPIRVCKSLFSIIESRVEHSKFSPLG